MKYYDGNFTIDYLGIKIHGYQIRVNKDCREELVELLQEIYAWKPYLIYNMGSENLIADLCGSFTTEVTIPFSSNYPISDGEYLILARNLQKNDTEFTDYIEKKKQTLIESIFVYKLQDPLKKYIKSDFDIPERSFVIVIVGARLDVEIDDGFVEILRQLLAQDLAYYLVFMGYFTRFEERKNKIGFADRIKYLGFQDDVRGVINIADIYLNPPRKGGGTSSVEALSEGVPVLTLPECDVANSVGEQFIYSDLKELPALVSRYKNDREFYRQQSKNALEQAERAINTEEVLRDVLNKIQ
jgi:glycosyltransferase involved in cell wall biosynthesis